MTDDLYQAIVLEAASQPQLQGTLPKPDLSSKRVQNSCGDAFSVEISLSSDKKNIDNLAWQGTGCAISIAALDLVAREVIGKPIASIRSWSEREVLELLGLEHISPSRNKCMLLGLQTIQEVLERI